MIPVRPKPFSIDALHRDETVFPWQHPPTVGRPPKEQEVRLRKDRKYKHCQGCGALGHNVRKCTKLDLDLYYRNLTREDDDEDWDAKDYASEEDEDEPLPEWEDEDDVCLDVPVPKGSGRVEVEAGDGSEAQEELEPMALSEEADDVAADAPATAAAAAPTVAAGAAPAELLDDGAELVGVEDAGTSSHGHKSWSRILEETAAAAAGGHSTGREKRHKRH